MAIEAVTRTLNDATQENSKSDVATFSKAIGQVISFKHLGTGHYVEFPATIYDFKDVHSVEYEENIGMNENAASLTGQYSIRQISFSFQVASSSIEEARFNQRSMNLLLSMMYGTLDEYDEFDANSKLPIEVKIGNILQSATTPDSGVKMFIQTLNYAPDLEMGVITNPSDKHDSTRMHQEPVTLGAINKPQVEIYPISITFNVQGEALIDGVASTSQNVPVDFPKYTSG